MRTWLAVGMAFALVSCTIETATSEGAPPDADKRSAVADLAPPDAGKRSAGADRAPPDAGKRSAVADRATAPLFLYHRNGEVFRTAGCQDPAAAAPRLLLIVLMLLDEDTSAVRDDKEILHRRQVGRRQYRHIEMRTCRHRMMPRPACSMNERILSRFSLGAIVSRMRAQASETLRPLL